MFNLSKIIAIAFVVSGVSLSTHQAIASTELEAIASSDDTPDADRAYERCEQSAMAQHDRGAYRACDRIDPALTPSTDNRRSGPDRDAAN